MKGNYELLNSRGMKTEFSFPRHKIKVIEDSGSKPEESEEVEKILDHRETADGYEFLVKWKLDPDNSWVPESNFNTVEILNDYFKSLRGEAVPTRKRGRPKKLNLLNALLLSLIFSFLFGCISCIKIKDSFTYCMIDENMAYWDDTNDCARADDIDAMNHFQRLQYFIWSKMHHTVSGIGYECMKKETVWSFEMSFLGDKYKSSLTRNVPLTKEECMVMVVTKKCERFNMECLNNVCNFDGVPLEAYKWWNTVSEPY